ncbi:MAG: class I SAM-dependent methyltransferase [Acidobacteriaceae bacterium]|nr:class I SAM-dependent methyltransferase [Acidobacteriaceae bacterium]MBV9296795.1 class I SAM-dependent methyltransferase [Acidobacteriaceae bacterium]
MSSGKRFLARWAKRARIAVAQLREALGIRSFGLYIDQPVHGEIQNAFFIIEGWFVSKFDSAPISLRVNNRDVAWTAVERPDVKRIFPRRSSQGFRAPLEVSRLLTDEVRSDKRTNLQFVEGGEVVAEYALTMSDEAIRDAELTPGYLRAKREWLKQNMACPLCPGGSGGLLFNDDRIQCINCGEMFVNGGTVFDFLPQDLRRQFRIEDVDDVSTHPYDDISKRVIEEARRKEGKVLDCGCGMRTRVDEAVICLDVTPFPTVDVLAVNQRLPFRNGVFDAVLSLNVLEHVTDPFLCAAELVRVLKPGGTLHCCIPFLQPEHGYPHHYFNATRSGLRELFASDLEILEHLVPRSGEPVWTLHWFLSWYAEQLPSQEKKAFLKMRVRDVIEESPSSLLDAPWVRFLSEDGKWKLASTTAAVFRKPLTDGLSER